MIRLLREVDYNKSDKTFYFNDAVYNVFVILISKHKNYAYIKF